MVRNLGAVGLAAVLLAAGPVPGHAQDLDFDAGGGVSLPTSALGQAWNPAPIFGLGVAHPVSERVDVRLDGGLELNPGTGAVPDKTTIRYTAGAEMRFTDPEDAPGWYTMVGLGGGAMRLSTDTYTRPGGGATDFVMTYPTFYGALRLGYEATPALSFSVRSRMWVTVIDPAEMQDFATLSGGGGFGREMVTIPLQLRVEVDPGAM